MTEENLFTPSWLKYVRGLALSAAIGFLGGVVCGSVILSLCGLAGRSRTTGTEYPGYWDFGEVLVGAMYGGPLGAILGPLGYIAVVRKIGFRSAILPAAIGPVVGGFAGSLVTPGFGVVTGTVGFFAGKFMHGGSSWYDWSPMGTGHVATNQFGEVESHQDSFSPIFLTSLHFIFDVVPSFFINPKPGVPGPTYTCSQVGGCE